MQASKNENITATASRSLFDKNYFTYIPPAFITLILLIGQVSFGILDSYIDVIAAIGASVIAEVLLARFVLGTKKNIASAYITGISVGILIRSNVLWPYVVTALISIMSKYVFKYRGRHLWNPSNFGVSWMLLMASPYVAGLSIQWGNNLAAMAVIWILGLGIVYRAKKIHISLTYVASFIILAYVRHMVTGSVFIAELAPLTGPMYQLFIFFMVTDPGTVVSKKGWQIVVVMLVAVVEFFLRLDGVIYAPFYALCLVGPVCKFIDLKRSAPRAENLVELSK